MKAKKAMRRKRERQIAALPLRAGPEGRMELLLITSRETRRWVIPKGNPIKGMKKAKVAAIEAHEEAGVVGKVAPSPYRSFDYWKRRSEGFVLCRVDVFPLYATRLEEEWKEKGERRRAWVPPAIAAHLVLEPGLQSILQELAHEPEVETALARHAKKVEEGALDLPVHLGDLPKRTEAEGAPETNWRFRGP